MAWNGNSVTMITGKKNTFAGSNLLLIKYAGKIIDDERSVLINNIHSYQCSFDRKARLKEIGYRGGVSGSFNEEL